jgi:hypothetical protein
MFRTALFIITKRWKKKSKCWPTDEPISKTWYIHTSQALEVALMLATTWINLKTSC